MQKKETNGVGSTLLLRIPPELKAALQREATARGRKLTAEVNIRLKESLELPGGTTGSVQGTSYVASHSATVLTAMDSAVEGGISNLDMAMLRVFKALPPEKQLALLSLFK